jgi:hypothetical protein
MGWITVYIRGKSGCEVEVLKNLEHSGLLFMPGETNEKGLSLFWIDEKEDLRDFKKAIGSKTIFKYRIRFFTNVEEFVESKHNAHVDEPFPQNRASAMQELNAWYEAKNR